MCRLVACGGFLAISLAIFIVFVSVITGLDAKPQSINDKYDSGVIRNSNLTFDEKLALSSQNRRPVVKTEQISSYKYPVFEVPTFPPFKPVTFAPIQLPKYVPLPTFAPLKPITFRPWSYKWVVPTFAPLKPLPTLPPYKQAPLVPVALSKGLPIYQPTKLDASLEKAVSSLPNSGYGSKVKNVGNTHTYNTFSLIIMNNCAPNDRKCAEKKQPILTHRADPVVNEDVNITEKDVQVILDLLNDLDEAYDSAPSNRDANEQSDARDPSNFLTYLYSAVDRINSTSARQARDLNTSGIVGAIDSKANNSDTGDLLPAPKPVSNDHDSKPSEITIPGSVGTADSKDSAHPNTTTTKDTSEDTKEQSTAAKVPGSVAVPETSATNTTVMPDN